MKSIYQKRAPIVFRTIVIITIFTLLYGNAVYAIGTNPEPNRQTFLQKNSLVANSRSRFGKDLFDNLFVPKSYGSIVEKWLPADNVNKEFIIYIEDAHCNYEAQVNIANILQHLIANYDIRLVNVEGSCGIVDTSLFGEFPYKWIREEVTDKYVKKGVITGPEYLSIKEYGELPFTLYGVEDSSLYIDNFNAFRDAYRYGESLNQFISELGKIVDLLKKRIFPEDLLGFDRNVCLYKKKEIELTQYCRYLETKSSFFNTNDYPAFAKILKTIEIEDKVDFDKVEKERADLIKELENLLVKEELELLVKKSLLFRLDKLSAEEFYTHLEDIITNVSGLDMESYPNLLRYIELVKIQPGIRFEHLFTELDGIERGIKKRLYEDKIEKELDILSSRVAILDGLLHLKLSRYELVEYNINRDRFKPDKLLSFVRIQAPLNQIPIPEIFNDAQFMEVIESGIQSAQRFYELALERDDILVENAISRMQMDDENTAVLISGGFHSEGIVDRLKKKDIGYITITPKITKKEEENHYLALMLDKRINLAPSGVAESIPVPSSISPIGGVNPVAEDTRLRMAADAVDRLREKEGILTETEVRQAIGDALAEKWEKEGIKIREVVRLISLSRTGQLSDEDKSTIEKMLQQADDSGDSVAAAIFNRLLGKTARVDTLPALNSKTGGELYLNPVPEGHISLYRKVYRVLHWQANALQKITEEILECISLLMPMSFSIPVVLGPIFANISSHVFTQSVIIAVPTIILIIAIVLGLYIVKKQRTDVLAVVLLALFGCRTTPQKDIGDTGEITTYDTSDTVDTGNIGDTGGDTGIADIELPGISLLGMVTMMTAYGDMEYDYDEESGLRLWFDSTSSYYASLLLKNSNLYPSFEYDPDVPSSYRYLLISGGGGDLWLHFRDDAWTDYNHQQAETPVLKFDNGIIVVDLNDPDRFIINDAGMDLSRTNGITIEMEAGCGNSPGTEITVSEIRLATEEDYEQWQTGDDTDEEVGEGYIRVAEEGLSFIDGQINEDANGLAKSYAYDSDNYSHVYDSGEALGAFVRAYLYYSGIGDTDKAEYYLEKAETLADVLLELQDESSYGVWADAYGSSSGAVAISDYTVGPNATIALALLNLYEVNGEDKYLTSAEGVLDWISSLQFDSDYEDTLAAGAVKYGESTSYDTTISAEHNIRAGKAFLKHHQLTGNDDSLTRALNIACWLVREMYGVEVYGVWQDRFAVGLSDAGDYYWQNWHIELALDIQALAIIFLHELNDAGITETEYNGVSYSLVYTDYSDAIEWIDDGGYAYTVLHPFSDCEVTGLPNVMGGSYIDAGLGGPTPSGWDNVWAEGTIAHAIAEQLLGRTEYYALYMEEMEKLYDSDTGGILDILGEDDSYGYAWPVHWPFGSIAATANWIYATLPHTDTGSTFYLVPPSGTEDTGSSQSIFFLPFLLLLPAGLRRRLTTVGEDGVARRQFLLWSAVMLFGLGLPLLPACRTDMAEAQDTSQEEGLLDREELVAAATKGLDFLSSMIGQVDESYGDLILSFDHEGREASWVFTDGQAISALIQGYDYFMGEGNDPSRAEGYLEDARRIADALIALQNEEGWWYNGYVAPGVSYLVPQNGSYIGPQATIARAMLELYETTNDESYLQSAEKALNWIKERQFDPDSDHINAGAIAGGLDDSRRDLEWVSAEENIRAARALMKYWLVTGDSESYNIAVDIANWLVGNMWSGERFYIGTTDYEVNNNVALGLDVQHLAIIFLSELYRYESDDKFDYKKYGSALEWVRSYRYTVDYEGQEVSGYGKVLDGDYTSVGDWEGWPIPDYEWANVWIEGTLGHAYAERLAGNTDEYEYLVSQMLKTYDPETGSFPHIIGQEPEEETGWSWPADYRYDAVDGTCNYIYLVLGTPDEQQEPFARVVTPGSAIRLQGGALSDSEHPVFNGCVKELILSGNAFAVTQGGPTVEGDHPIRYDSAEGGWFRENIVPLFTEQDINSKRVVVIEGLKKKLREEGGPIDMIFHPGYRREAVYIDKEDYDYLKGLDRGAELIAQGLLHELTHLQRGSGVSEEEIEKIAPSVEVRLTFFLRDIREYLRENFPWMRIRSEKEIVKIILGDSEEGLPTLFEVLREDGKITKDELAIIPVISRIISRASSEWRQGMDLDKQVALTGKLSIAVLKEREKTRKAGFSEAFIDMLSKRIKGPDELQGVLELLRGIVGSISLREISEEGQSGGYLMPENLNVWDSINEFCERYGLDAGLIVDELIMLYLMNLIKDQFGNVVGEISAELSKGREDFTDDTSCIVARYLINKDDFAKTRDGQVIERILRRNTVSSGEGLDVRTVFEYLNKQLNLLRLSARFFIDSAGIGSSEKRTVLLPIAAESKDRQETVAGRFIDTLRSESIRDKKIILAWDDNIETGEVHKAFLTDLDLVNNLENIHFIRARGNNLCSAIDEKLRTLEGEADVIVIGKRGNKEAGLYNKLEEKKRTYIMAMDDSKIQGTMYLPILEILTFAMSIVYEEDNYSEVNRLYKEITGEELSEDDYNKYRRNITEQSYLSIVLTLLPVAPIDLDRLREIYNLSISILAAA